MPFAPSTQAVFHSPPQVVDTIPLLTGSVEIVDYNMKVCNLVRFESLTLTVVFYSQQYVCAGDYRSADNDKCPELSQIAEDWHCRGASALMPSLNLC